MRAVATPAAAPDIPIVERGAEVAALRSLILGAREGRGGVLVLEGAAGTGKTRLLGVAGELAAAGSLAVLEARGAELESQLELGLARQLLEPVAAPLAKRAHELFSVLTEFTARRPHALLVDDLQWGDTRSLRFLDYLARRVQHLPVALVLAGRPPSADGDRSLMTISGAGAPVIRLRPLSDQGSTAVVACVFGEPVAPEFARACHRATAGNPYLLHELASELAAAAIAPTEQAAGSIEGFACPGVARSVALSLARLPEAARGVARAVAMLETAPVRHVAAVLGLDVAAAGELADVLAAAGVLERGRPLRFLQPLVRKAVYDATPPAARARLHAQAAQVLAGESAPVEVIAAHLLRTEPSHEHGTVAGLRAAAERAAAMGAADRGVTYLRRALVEPPASDERPEVLAELGALEIRVGSPTGIENMLEALAGSDDPRRRGEIVLALAPALMYAGRVTLAADLLQAAVEGLGAEGGRLARRLELELLASSAMGAGLRMRPERIGELRERVGSPEPEDGLVALLAGFAAGAADEAILSAGAATALAGRALAGDRHCAGPGAACLAVDVLIRCDELDRAERAIEEVLSDASSRGSAFERLVAVQRRVELRLRRGALLGAEADARTVLEEALRSPFQAVAAHVRAQLAATLSERGDLEAADALLAEGDLRGAATEAEILLLESRCSLRLAQGRAPEALADARSVHDLSECRLGPGRRPASALLAAALAANAELQPARAAASCAVAEARAFGSPRSLGIALRTAALCEPGEGSLDILEEAVHVLRSSPSRLEYAKAVVDYGAALRRANRRARSREPLREGLELARDCGAASLADRAEVELRATGARPRGVHLSGVEALTASERRVATLAAAGVANREISRQLFVTLRTVETHLTSVYRKLGISCRRELATTLAPIDR